MRCRSNDSVPIAAALSITVPIMHYTHGMTLDAASQSVKRHSGSTANDNHSIADTLEFMHRNPSIIDIHAGATTGSTCCLLEGADDDDDDDAAAR